MKRRDFFKLSGLGLATGGLLNCSSPAKSAEDATAGSAGKVDDPFTRRAAWFQSLEKKRVRCGLCPTACVLQPGQTGLCRVRSNVDGELVTRVFGRLVAMANDPIEKKPLNHFLPGSKALSVSTVGCNFACRFCQNWEISQSGPEERRARFGYVSPAKLVAMAKKRGAQSIAFTYGEPVVFFEYMLETARLARKEGIHGVMISNGYIQPGPLDELLKVLSAIKVDFKAYDERFYRELCSGSLQPVLKTLEKVAKSKVWLEMVHLTIPSLNDGLEAVDKLAGWVKTHLGPDVPLHFTRFHPTYKLRNLPPTPVRSLVQAYERARAAGLHYVYVGNLPGHDAEHTRCHVCGELIIERVGYSVRSRFVEPGRCPKCSAKIPGVWR